MGKVIDMTAPVRWFIDITENEFVRCRYVEAGDSFWDTAHWRVVVEAPTTERLKRMLDKAQEELAKQKAVRRRR